MEKAQPELILQDLIVSTTKRNLSWRIQRETLSDIYQTTVVASGVHTENEVLLIVKRSYLFFGRTKYFIKIFAENGTCLLDHQSKNVKNVLIIIENNLKADKLKQLDKFTRNLYEKTI